MMRAVGVEGALLKMEVTMRFQEIQKMAKGLGLKPYRMKKMELIHAIQGVERNIPCFGTQRVYNCQEEECLWRADCIKLNGNGLKM